MAEINGVFVDDIVASQIERIRNDVLKHDKDKVILFDGREGSGKSVLSMQIAKALDPNFNLDKIAYNGDQFMKLLKDPARKKGDFILLDEAFNSASARSSLSYINKAMIGVATEMRQLNLFVGIVLPSFFDLDRYFAIWRCETLFHVYFNKKGKRGQYTIFPFKKKLKLYLKGKKFYSYGCVKSPYPPCKFSNAYVVDEAEYRKRKAEAFRKRESVDKKEKMWRDCFIRLALYLRDKKGFTYKQISLVSTIAYDTLQNYVESKDYDSYMANTPIIRVR